MLYSPHPDSEQSTAFKIRRLFNVGRMPKEEREKLDKILNEFSKYVKSSNEKRIKSLEEEVAKFRKIKEYLK